MVATPIGNLDDLSRRAVSVLSSVETIAAEDTRRTGRLLSDLGIPRRDLAALHDHNENQVGPILIEKLKAGQDIALVSDAGTPLVSDPGFELVRSAWQEGIRVVPIPGASAVSAALSVCPLPAQDYRFVGFLPARSATRKARLTELLDLTCAVVFFEAPHRIEETLAVLNELAPERRLMIGRELTKLFETCLAGRPADLLEQLRANNQVRGEFVCVLEAGESKGISAEANRVLKTLCAELPPATAAKLTAEICGGRKADYYPLAVALKGV